MDEPLVSITMSKYNELLGRKTFNEIFTEVMLGCKTWIDFKEKIENYKWVLDNGGQVATIKMTCQIPEQSDTKDH